MNLNYSASNFYSSSFALAQSYTTSPGLPMQPPAATTNPFSNVADLRSELCCIRTLIDNLRGGEVGGLPLDGDRLFAGGGRGDDRIHQFGGRGNDLLRAHGRPGDDRIVQRGGPGSDKLVARGGRGDDVIRQHGGRGNDLLRAHGGPGDDRIVQRGGPGNDKLVARGGAGNDRIRLNGGAGNDSAVVRLKNNNFTVLGANGDVLHKSGKGGTKIRVKNIEDLKVKVGNKTHQV